MAKKASAKLTTAERLTPEQMQEMADKFACDGDASDIVAWLSVLQQAARDARTLEGLRQWLTDKSAGDWMADLSAWTIQA